MPVFSLQLPQRVCALESATRGKRPMQQRSVVRRPARLNNFQRAGAQGPARQLPQIDVGTRLQDQGVADPAHTVGARLNAHHTVLAQHRQQGAIADRQVAHLAVTMPLVELLQHPGGIVAQETLDLGQRGARRWRRPAARAGRWSCQACADWSGSGGNRQCDVPSWMWRRSVPAGGAARRNNGSSSWKRRSIVRGPAAPAREHNASSSDRNRHTTLPMSSAARCEPAAKKGAGARPDGDARWTGTGSEGQLPRRCKGIPSRCAQQGLQLRLAEQATLPRACNHPCTRSLDLFLASASGGNGRYRMSATSSARSRPPSSRRMTLRPR
jgi:hypothetical protein